MNPISIPLIPIFAIFISIIILGILLVKRKHLVNEGRKKTFWICIFSFVFIYLFIIVSTTYIDIQDKMYLNTFDLNKDGFFTNNEINPAQIKAMKKVSNSTAKDFSVVTGFFFSGIITVLLLMITKMASFIIKKMN